MKASNLSICRKALALVLLGSFLVGGCGSAEPTVTALPATATRIAVAATNTPQPPTATPVPPMPTNTPVPPTETAAPSSTATPMPTAPATATPAATGAPGFTLYPEPGTRLDGRTYGGQYTDWGYDILLLNDGGTLIVGQADNTGPSHRIYPGKARLIRTDAEGNVVWQKDYGGEVDAMFYCPIQTGDDEYVILGQIAASYARDEEDIYLVKIDGQGNEIWSQTYGGRGMDVGKMVRQTSDGGFILVGDRADEFPSGGLYQSDLVLIKADAEGNEVWTRTYGDEIMYLGWGVAQTPDGGYILSGWEAKTIPDRDVIAIKTDESGEVEWKRTWDLDPGDRDGGFDMILTADGHAVIAGIKSMDDGPRRAVLIKVDLEGNEVWVKEYDAGDEGSEFWDIMEDTDGGYVMAGGRYLTSIDRATGEAVREGLVIKTDPEGEVLWQHTVSSGEYESMLLSSAVVLPGRGYIFVGAARPSGKRHWDMLRLKLTTGGQVIAFTSNREDGEGDIYIMNADGSNPQRLTDDPAYDGWPTWSPDGSQIAFMSDRSGNPDIYVMAVPDGTAADGAEPGSGNVRQLTDHPANDIWPEWSPDGKRIAFPSRRDGNFEIYVINADGTNLQRLTNTPGHEDFPTWSPDGTQILYSRVESDEGTYVMAVPDGAAPGSGQERRLLDFVILEPAWSPDGTRIAFGSDHEGFRAIYVMDADGGNLQKLSNTRAGENCPAWSPDGRRIAFASWRDGDGEIYVMDVGGVEQGSRNLQKLTENRFEDEFPAWRPASLPAPIDSSAPAKISVDTADQVELLSTLGGHSNKVIDLVFSGDGTFLASSSLDRTIKLWDVASRQEVHAFPMNKVGFNGIALSPDGRLLASADAIWDLESKEMVHELERDRRDPGPVAFSPDGTLLAVALEGQPIKLWDVAGGEVLRTFAEQPDEVTFRIVFSPDGALLAAGVHGGIVRLWDVESGQAAGTLEYGQEYHDVHDVAFSPDGKTLASGGTDETIRLWDVADRNLLHALRQGNGLYGVAISPDGTLVASAGCDRTVKLWDAASGRLVRSLAHADEVMTVAFSPDGSLLASGGYDDQVYLWGIPR